MSRSITRMMIVVAGLLLVMVGVAVLLARHDAARTVAPAASPSPLPASHSPSSSSSPIPLAGPQHVSVGEAADQLAALVVAPAGSMAGFDPAAFPLWMPESAECDTNRAVLLRAGSNVVTDGGCDAVEGIWVSLYDGRVITRPDEVVVDRLVPYADAWASGADAWTEDQRRGFANDLRSAELVAVSVASHTAKGDLGPDRWKPPLETSWCRYAAMWVQVKTAWNLRVTPAEKAALAGMLRPCQE